MARASTKVKICGLTREDGVEAVIESGADYIGVVLLAKSPRTISIERAAELLDPVPRKILRVGLFVEPDDKFLEETLKDLRLDLLQLHGKETPNRIEAVRKEFGIPVMKALGIFDASDLQRAREFEDVADITMFDAKPPKGADRPGGHGKAFDWTLLAGLKWKTPWMLAGGLTPENVAQAVELSGAKIVDVSSGVESAPGVKDPDKIRRFVAAAKAAA